MSFWSFCKSFSTAHIFGHLATFLIRAEALISLLFFWLFDSYTVCLLAYSNLLAIQPITIPSGLCTIYFVMRVWYIACWDVSSRSHCLLSVNTYVAIDIFFRFSQHFWRLRPTNRSVFCGFSSTLLMTRRLRLTLSFADSVTFSTTRGDPSAASAAVSTSQALDEELLPQAAAKTFSAHSVAA